MLRTLLGPVVLALVLPATLAAQSQATTGIIRGTVSDPSGAAVSGATVVLREGQTGFQRQVTTNERGIFVAPLMPLGTYDVSARGVGFAETRRTGVRLGVGATVDLNLALAAVQLQAVVVEATQPIVDANKVEASTRLPDAAVSRLPNNGRNYLNLTLLTPNVAIVQGPDGDELSIGGQKGIHNNVSVDGADFNNPFFGEQRGGQRPPFTFNLDAVQEIVVTSSGAAAEFGRSSGGFVNVVTKSGTNQLHGSVHYYGKDGALSGVAHHGTQSLTPDFTQHQFGFTLGGPIKRDRAFFFVAYDQQIYDETKQTDPNRIAAPLRAVIDPALSLGRGRPLQAATDPFQLGARCLQRHRHQARFVGSGRDARHRAHLRVGDAAGGERLVDRGERAEGARYPHLLARGPGVQADSPGQPVGAALRALLEPRLRLVEPPDARQQAVRCNVNPSGNLRDLLTQRNVDAHSLILNQ